MSSKKIYVQCTKNYRLFGRSQENRPVDLKKHKSLIDSFKLYGFLCCFPVVCVRDASGNLIVKDGQHRVAIAEMVGVPVWWIETDIDFDVAKINTAQEKWTVRDYAMKFAANGLDDYQEVLDFSARHRITVGNSFSLLGGTISFTNVQFSVKNGTYKIKDRAWAEDVAAIFTPISELNLDVRNARFLEACMWVARVPEFDAGRLLQNARRCREKLCAYSTRDANLDMIEDIYNFNRKTMVGLKVAAVMAMRQRNVCPKDATSKTPVSGSAQLASAAK